MKGSSATKATGGKPKGARPVTGSTSASKYGPGKNTSKRSKCC